MTVWHLLFLGDLLLAVLATEFFVLYASTALSNVDIKLNNWFAGAVVAALSWAALAYGGYWIIRWRSADPENLLAGENTSLLLIVASTALFASWLLMGLAFKPVFSTTLWRGVLASMFQVVLRLFLYVLIAGAVFVVLASMQMLSGPAAKKPAGAALPAVRAVG